MKKILTLTVILCVVFYGHIASACSQTTESITGAACSIKELQNLEKGRQTTDNPSNSESKDLRPLRLNVETKKNEQTKCLFGPCLYRTLFKD